MLDSGDGGGYNGTNWNAMPVIDMWMTLQNQDTTPHWELVNGWRKSYELTLQHMSAVRSYRDNLATAWPPEKSEAAAAYIARLDELLTHLQQTYDAAIANYGALSSATLSLSAARRDLEKVVTEYVANEAALVDFERAKEVAAMPVGGKGGVPRPTPQSPVADGRQAALESKARGIMTSLSIDLMQAKGQLKRPEPYNYEFVEKEPSGGGTGDPVYVPPPIPAVVPFNPDAGSASSSSAPFPTGANSAPTGPPTASPGRLPGLVLGGTQPPVIAPPSAPPISPPVVGGSQPITPLSPIAPVAPGAPGRPSAPARFNPAASGKPAGSATIGPRSAPTGGVIGARPGGGPSANPVGPGRVPAPANPVGGVIAPGQQPRGGAAPGRTVGQPIGPFGAVPRAQDDEAPTTNRWDPDNPWETAKGVDPVLMPPEEKPIDPGPAIGLS